MNSGEIYESGLGNRWEIISYSPDEVKVRRLERKVGGVWEEASDKESINTWHPDTMTFFKLVSTA